MLRAMDSAVAGLRAHQNKLDVIGHNIANVNTYGYKTQSYTFKEAMYQTSSASTGGTSGEQAAGGTNAAQYGYGTMMGTIVTDMSASTPTYVGGFNASINGEGFFITLSSLKKDGVAVNSTELKSNDFDFTRVGMFSIDSNGYMVDSTGNFVYGFAPDPDAQNGVDAGKLVALRAPINVVANTQTDENGVTTTTYETTFGHDGDALQLADVSVNNLGEVTATIRKPDDTSLDGVVVSLGKVAIATFQNPNGMTKKGDIYYGATTSDNSGQVSATAPGGTTASLMTGYVEASNVDLAQQFSDMITTQRGFQANAKIVTVSDEILSELINMKR